MIIKNLYDVVLLISTLSVLKCFSKKNNFLYVGENLYYSTIESALQECIDNYGGLQNVETSIFIKSGTYRPKNSLRFTVFGETSTINFIGEGVDKTILECHTLNKLIAFQANSEYQHHVWTFENMTMKGCEKKSEIVNVNSGTVNFVNVKFTGNINAGAVVIEGAANANFNNTIFVDNYEGPNISLGTSGNVGIYNSKILGFPECFRNNKLCKDKLVNILSYDNVKIIIENSEISNSIHTANEIDNGANDYMASLGAINFASISIKNSLFSNSNAYVSGAISLGYWKLELVPTLNVYNTTFKNNMGSLASAIRIAGRVNVDVQDCYFYNNTSSSYGIFVNGGDLSAYGEIFPSKFEISNSYFENPWENDYEYYANGRLYTSYGYGPSYFRNITVNNFYNGNLLNTPYSTVFFTNSTFSNYNLNIPLFNLLNQDEEFIFERCIFKNISIDHEEYGMIYTNKNAGKLTISNSDFIDITSTNAAIILSEINCGSDIYFNNNTFTDIYSKNGVIVIKNEDAGSNKFNGIIIKNCTFGNCSSEKTAILSIDYGSFANITECSFINCGSGNEHIEFISISGSILQISGSSKVNFENNIIDECYSSDYGGAINMSLQSELNINNSTFTNCEAGSDGGILSFNNWDGSLIIKNSEFINNEAHIDGGIMKISDDDVLEHANILIEASNFTQNRSNLGGVVYIGTITSKFDVTKNLKIKNSNFIDNEANSGENLFVSEASQAKYIFDGEVYDENKVNSHPCNLSWNDNSVVIHNNDRKNLKSGDSIPNGLVAYILSDTNRLYDIVTQDIDFVSNVLFVNATILDQYGKETNDAIIVGDRETFCWEGKCNLNTVKIYGKEGQYILKIYVISNGGFISMNSKSVTVDITIEKCDRQYNNDYLNIGFNICYDPACSKCIHGSCGDMNICTCTDPKIWKGDACDERYKYKYSSVLRVLYEIICAISVIFSLFLIYGIWSNQNESIIRKSNPTFLIVAIVGSIINYSTVIFYHGNRTSTLCSIVLWIKFIGFATLYGSIMIRIMRVWRIISSTKQKFKTSKMSKSAMFTYLFIIIFVYILILITCTIIQKVEIDIKVSSEKEFNKCKNSPTMYSLYGLTIAMLIWGVYLALETSNLPEQFNEAKSVGISTYVYAFSMIISETIDNFTILNPDYSYLLNLSSMLIYTWTSIFTIVVPKVYVIYSEWFVVFDILKRNVNGTENAITVEKSELSNGNYMNNMAPVGGLSVIDRK